MVKPNPNDWNQLKNGPSATKGIKLWQKICNLTTMEERNGKSLISLRIMEFVSRRMHNIGFFRPIIPDVAIDNNIQLILNRLSIPPDQNCVNIMQTLIMVCANTKASPSNWPWTP